LPPARKRLPWHANSASAEWQAEIQRRCAEIDNGAVTMIPGNQALAQLRAKYTARDDPVDIEPVHVVAWVELKTRSFEPQTVKQQLAAQPV
jgi:hypothetical protein